MQEDVTNHETWEVIGEICTNLEIDELPIVIFEKTRWQYCGELIDQHCKSGSKVVCFDYDGFFVWVDIFEVNDKSNLTKTVQLSIDVSELSKIADSIIAIIKAWAVDKKGGEKYEANDLS